MHVDRPLGDAKHFERGPYQSHSHGNEEEQCKHNFSTRISLRQLPQAQDTYLRVTDEDLEIN